MNNIFRIKNNHIIVAPTLAIIVADIIESPSSLSSMISVLTMPLQTLNTLAFALQPTLPEDMNKEHVV